MTNSDEMREKWETVSNLIGMHLITGGEQDPEVWDLLLLMAELSHECGKSTTPYRLRVKIQQILDIIKRENDQSRG